MVVGVIFVGLATPSESAASGALATFLLALARRHMNWEVFKRAIVGSLEISVMLLFIISGAIASPRYWPTQAQPRVWSMQF